MGQGEDRALNRLLSAPTVRERDTRAAALLAKHPHAAEPLGFYRAILHSQEPLGYHSRLPTWLALADSDGVAGSPLLCLERLPVPELEEDFRQFLEEIRPAMTVVLAPTASRLSLNVDIGRRLLGAFMAGEPLVMLADEAECSAQELEFFPHAFLQPIAERLAALAVETPRNPADALAGVAGEVAPRSCPCCGRLPVVGLLTDEPGAQGRRRLVCSLCGTAWPFPRLTCAGCGETAAEKLTHHVGESWPHIRIEECLACATYLKTVDQRSAGHAVPLVDELASLELDLWADGRGLEKLERNLLGL